MATNTSTSTIRTGVLNILRPVLQASATLPGRMSWDAWLSTEETRGERVAKYRKYVFGEHDVELTDRMKAQLRLNLEDRSLALNHCEKIIEKLANRLELETVQAVVRNDDRTTNEEASKQANEWIEDLFDENRLDSLQLAAHNDGPQDGMTFILIEYDKDEDRVKLVQEPAYDGHSGMLVVYGVDNMTPTLAIKLWHETQVGAQSDIIDNVRVNLYFEDRIEKYISRNSGPLAPWKDKETDPSNIYPQKSPDGKPMGVPVIPFVYKGRRYNKHGLGRLDNVMWVQDVLNRVFLSIVATGENTGFQIKYLIGLEPPEELTPGTILHVAPPTEKDPITGKPKATRLTDNQVEMLKAIQIGQLPAGDANALLNIAVFARNEMYRISGTPYYEDVTSGISGETLKQLDIDLVATANKCHVSFGNAWEDVVKIAARYEVAYGSPETGKRVMDAKLRSVWHSAEIRDDTAVINNAKTTGDFINNLDVRTKIEMIASVHGWDKNKVDEIVGRIEETASKAADSELNKLIPGFGGGGEALNQLNGNGSNPLAAEQGGGTVAGDPLNGTPPPNPLPAEQRGGTNGN